MLLEFLFQGHTQVNPKITHSDFLKKALTNTTYSGIIADIKDTTLGRF